MNILVSACLLGMYCRYDGKEQENSQVIKLIKTAERHMLIPVCPEQAGGMMTPRLPSECRDGRVVNREGEDVTSFYEKGAEQALKLARLYHCDYAVLKERSPSCGKGTIYDGTFSGVLTGGDGVTAALLEKNGIRVFGESQIEELLENLKDR